MDKLKLIKTAVIILTFLLVFGTLSFLGLLYKKTHAIVMPLPEAISLNQPTGSYIKQMSLEKNLIYILAIGGGLNDRIIIFDSDTAKIKTTININ